MWDVRCIVEPTKTAKSYPRNCQRRLTRPRPRCISVSWNGNVEAGFVQLFLSFHERPRKKKKKRMLVKCPARFLSLIMIGVSDRLFVPLGDCSAIIRDTSTITSNSQCHQVEVRICMTPSSPTFLDQTSILLLIGFR